MRIGTLIRRFFIPSFVITLLGYARFGAFISPRAEVEWGPNFTLGKGSRISAFCKLKSSRGPLRIGRRVDVASGCFISAGEEGIEIGDLCLIGPNCTIVGTAYRYDDLNTPIADQGSEAKPTRLGSNIFLAAGCVVAAGADIGDGVIVGANSVVTGKLPPNAIAQGNPAKVIFERR